MSNGVRGLLAHWLGGAGAPASSTAAAPRGLFAFWLGGAGVGVSPSTSASMRGMFAFWAGGAAVTASVTPPEPTPDAPLSGNLPLHRIARRPRSDGARFRAPRFRSR